MKVIEAGTYNIEIGSLSETSFESFLSKYDRKKKVVMVDENTWQCFQRIHSISDELKDAEVIQVPCGEEAKDLEIVAGIWQTLTELQIGLDDLIINIGGGVVCDLGGFIASTYKRGVQFIQLPTSLLAMVDASVGGKTGINFLGYKNLIGTFADPQAVYVAPEFLDSLPEEERTNGFAEMLKHGLIDERGEFENLLLKGPHEISENEIYTSVSIKTDIVTKDPKENSLRKLLNFGHTAGHALESYINEAAQIGHGHAVAVGMMIEAQIAFKHGLLSNQTKEKIINGLKQYYSIPNLQKDEMIQLFEFVWNDKKNREGVVLMVGIKEIGQCVIDHAVKPDDFIEAYLSLQEN